MNQPITASIGLAQLDAVTKRLYDALPASPNDAPDDSRELWYIHEDLRQLARRSLTSGVPAEPVYQARPFFPAPTAWYDIDKQRYDEIAQGKDCPVRIVYAAPIEATSGAPADASHGAAAPSAEQAVAFIGVDPLNIGKGAVLPMIPDSWRFGFYKVGDELRFGYQDAGPLVAWDAVKDAIANGGQPNTQMMYRADFEQFCDYMLDGTDTVDRDWLFHFCTALLAKQVGKPCACGTHTAAACALAGACGSAGAAAKSEQARINHGIADRLSGWLSSSLDDHLRQDEYRKHIRAWLDFNGNGELLSASAAGAGSELPNERALFQRETLRLDILDDEGTWAGANSPDGWYYFDDEVNGCWKTWQARAALAKQADAGVSQQAGVHAGELAGGTVIDYGTLAQQGAAQATSASASGELLPCPFCGGRAAYNSDHDDRGNAVIECVDCGASAGANMPPVGARWNRRTPAPSQAAPLEAQAGAEKGEA